MAGNRRRLGTGEMKPFLIRKTTIKVDFASNQLHPYMWLMMVTPSVHNNKYGNKEVV